MANSFAPSLVLLVHKGKVIMKWTLKNLTNGYTFQFDPTFVKGDSIFQFGTHNTIIDTGGDKPSDLWGANDIAQVKNYLVIYPTTENPFPFGYDVPYSVNYPIVLGVTSIDPTISNLPQQSTQSGPMDSISDLPSGTPIGNDMVTVPTVAVASTIAVSTAPASNLFIYAVLLVLIFIFLQRG